MSRPLACPACSHPLHLPVGDKACPYCRHLRPTVRTQAVQANPSPPPVSARSIQAEPPTLAATSLRSCPSCGKTISELCRHCPHCERPLEQVSQAVVPDPTGRRTEKGWQRPWLAWLGGLVLAAGLLGAAWWASEGIPGGLFVWGMSATFVLIVAVVNAGASAKWGLRAVLLRALSLIGVIFLGVALAAVVLLCVGLLVRRW